MRLTNSLAVHPIGTARKDEYFYKKANKIIIMFSHKGLIHRISETRLVGANDFPVREIIITQDDEFSPLIPFQLIGKNTGLVEQLGMEVGDNITVKFSIGGRERETATDEIKVYSNNTITFIEQD